MTEEKLKRLDEIADELTAMVIDDEFGAHNGNIILSAIDSITEVHNDLK